jgi:hypothetical protein
MCKTAVVMVVVALGAIALHESKVMVVVALGAIEHHTSTHGGDGHQKQKQQGDL